MQFMATAANEARTLDDALVGLRDLLLAEPDWVHGVAFTVVAGASSVWRPLGPAAASGRPGPRSRSRRRCWIDRSRSSTTRSSPGAWSSDSRCWWRATPTVVVVVTAYADLPHRRALGALVAQVAGQLSQVAARERLVAALSRSQSQLAEAQAIARIGSWEIHTDPPEVTWSAQMYALLDLDPGETVAGPDTFFGCLVEEDRDRVVAEWEGLALEPGERCIDARVRRRDGSARWVRTVGRVLEQTVDGAPVRFGGTVQDINELKEAELKLHRRRRPEHHHAVHRQRGERDQHAGRGARARPRAPARPPGLGARGRVRRHRRRTVVPRGGARRRRPAERPRTQRRRTRAHRGRRGLRGGGPASATPAGLPGPAQWGADPRPGDHERVAVRAPRHAALDGRAGRRPAGPGRGAGARREPARGRARPGDGGVAGQVGLPGHDEPRDPDTAQRGDRPQRPAAAHGPRPAAAPARRGDAGRRTVPARADQRHPRLLQDRGRRTRARSGGLPARGRRTRHPRAVRADGARQGHRARRRDLRRRPGPARGGPEPASDRCCRTWWPTRSSSPTREASTCA